MLILFIHLIMASSFAGTLTHLDLNDVSILLPLPSVTDWNQLPKASTMGAQGSLLPQTYYKHVPPLLGAPTNEVLYADFRVVGIRFDPCFHEGPAPVRCKAQIRMVWQPLERVNETTSTLDVSLHVFYELKYEEFRELLIQVNQLKSKKVSQNKFLALTVNPFLKEEGLTGDYYQKLNQMILQYVGEKNISRITFMQLLGNGMVWDFGGFDIKDHRITKIEIPRVQSDTQRFVNGAALPKPVNFLGGIIPEPEFAENLNFLLRDSREVTAKDETEIIAAVRAAFRFENPRLHNPGTVDCVSCHVAQSARIWSTRQFPELSLERLNDSQIYKSERNLTNRSPLQLQTNVVRAFGYFRDQPAISQRTINESADVMKYIDENF